MTKTHWKKLHNPDYLGSYSLANEQGGFNEVDVTIKQVTNEIITGEGNKKDECIVLRFAEFNKPMVCNATNAKSIVKVTGSSFIEDWIGKRVTLYVSKIKAFGDVVDALRIKSKAPAPVALPELKLGSTEFSNVVNAIKLGNADIGMARNRYKISGEVEKEILNATNPVHNIIDNIAPKV